MQKIIKVGEIDVPFKATASTALRFREQTGKDLMKMLMSQTKATEVDTEFIGEFAYVMAKQANPDIPAYTEWLDGFEPLDLINAAPEIFNLWGLSATPLEKSKKK